MQVIENLNFANKAVVFTTNPSDSFYYEAYIFIHPHLTRISYRDFCVE